MKTKVINYNKKKANRNFVLFKLAELFGEMKCIYCKYEMTNHETLNKQTNPKVGDVSFCVNCGGVSIFTKDNKLKRVNVGTLEKDVQAEIYKISRAWLKSQMFALDVKDEEVKESC